MNEKLSLWDKLEILCNERKAHGIKTGQEFSDRIQKSKKSVKEIMNKIEVLGSLNKEKLPKILQELFSEELLKDINFNFLFLRSVEIVRSMLEALERDSSKVEMLEDLYSVVHDKKEKKIYIKDDLLGDKDLLNPLLSTIMICASTSFPVHKLLQNNTVIFTDNMENDSHIPKKSFLEFNELISEFNNHFKKQGLCLMLN